MGNTKLFRHNDFFVCSDNQYVALLYFNLTLFYSSKSTCPYCTGLTFNLQTSWRPPFPLYFMHITDSLSVSNILDIYIHIAYKK